MEINFLGEESQGRSLSVSAEETINLYPETADSSYMRQWVTPSIADSKSRLILIGTPGTKLFTNISAMGYCRTLYASALGRLFSIVGNGFYEIFQDKTYKLIGTIDTNSGMVSVAENNFQIMLADGVSGHIFTTATNAFSKITSADYVAGNSVVSNNGFFVQNSNNSGNFYISAYNNGFTWNAANFSNAERFADNIDTITTNNNELILFGKKSIELWYNHPSTSGDVWDIYSRINQGFINIGIGAIQSVASINNTVFWLGSNLEGNNIIWMMQGYQPTRISTHAVEYQLGRMNNTSDAVAYCYQQEGHSFYVITFVKDNKTLVYDLSTGMWHERGKWNKSTGCNDAHSGICAVFWNGKNYIGDYNNGNIYELNLDVYTDNGTPIMRRRTGGHIHSDRQRLFFNEFELDLQRGIGTINGQGIDAKICLQWSNDGGETWSNEYWNSAGKIGNYKARCHWHRLGYSRDRIFRVTMSDPVKWVLIGARGDIVKEAA